MSRLVCAVCCVYLAAVFVGHAAVVPPLDYVVKSKKSVKDDPTPPTPQPPNPLPPLPPDPVPPQPAPTPIVPTLSLPATVEGEVGDFIEIIPQTNCKTVRYYVIDKGLKKLPDSVALQSSTVTVVQSMVAGQYRMMAVAAMADDIVGPVEFMVVVHGPQPPPAPPQPPIPPGPQPPAPPAPGPVNPTATKLWIVTVDNWGARTATTALVLNDNTVWSGFKAAGHQYLKIDSTEPAANTYRTQINANGGIPCVIIMDASKTEHNWLNQNPADMKLPTTPAGLKALVDKYTAK